MTTADVFTLTLPCRFSLSCFSNSSKSDMVRCDGSVSHVSLGS